MNRLGTAPNRAENETQSTKKRTKYRAIGDLMLGFANRIGYRTREQRIREQASDLDASVQQLKASHHRYVAIRTQHELDGSHMRRNLAGSPNLPSLEGLHQAATGMIASVHGGLVARFELHGISDKAIALLDRWGVGKALGIRPSAVDEAVHGLVACLHTEEYEPRPLSEEVVAKLRNATQGLTLDEQTLAGRVVYGILYDSARITVGSADPARRQDVHDDTMRLLDLSLAVLTGNVEESNLVRDRIDDGVAYEMLKLAEHANNT